MVTLADRLGPLGMLVFWPLGRTKVELENESVTESYRPEVMAVDKMVPGTYLPLVGSRSNPRAKWFWMVTSPVPWGKPAV